ncbi:MAG TPA: glycosyltransferase family 2 protein [Anaerolineae bacterium]|nr:glycosyltransferase family 2 protein [Anaerolineae bacterium]
MMTPQLTSITAFFPCYNDAGTIPAMILRAVQTLRAITDDYEILVINDGSSDDSARVLDELALHYDCLRVIHRTRPSGYGGVLRAGFAAATKDWIFYTDGDAQYDARELAVLVAALDEGVDVVNGYKIKRRDPFHRVVIGLAYQYFVKLAFGLVIRDVDCDFRLMRRAIFENVTLESTTGTITFEMVKKIQAAGYRIVEVPVHHWYRQYGQSQFFNFPRVARTLIAMVGWWWRLVVKREHLRNTRLQTAAPPDSREPTP